MTLTLELSPELQQRLQAAAQARGVTPHEFAVKILDEKLPTDPEQRRKAAVAMLDEWLAEADEDEDREAYEELTKALDEDRPSYRKLYPPELKGITW
jgi:predicted transcriptional regulator